MPIQILPSELINQIAAGEIVERPVAVVKELLENSLDAGSTHIEINIEHGGTQCIRVRDNGSGIAKEELVLALARHATSKIASMDDLESITSMGFRGEALASVSSVSRLILTSRTTAQTTAWQAYAEGRELTVTLKPVAHPVGTTVEVLDLFYNTPARRKFMRTEKTEFIHIDEIIRRIALTRFDVTFILQHNGRVVRQYHAVKNQSQHSRRLGKLCGSTFVRRALSVSWQHDDLAIHGWVASTTGEKLPEIQYSYVNQRTIRDKVIIHAIRQAYQDQEQWMETQQLAFVLFLNMEPRQIDVNIHPTKHAVRFHQERLVHDFIYHAVGIALQQQKSIGEEPTLPISRVETWSYAPHNRQVAGRNYFSLPTDGDNNTTMPRRHSFYPGYQRIAAGPCSAEESAYPAYKKNMLPFAPRDQQSTLSFICQAPVNVKPTVASNVQSFGSVLTIVSADYALVELAIGRLALLSLPVAERYLVERQLTPGTDQLRVHTLLFPLDMKLSHEETLALKRHQSLLQDMGILIQVHLHQTILHAVPLPLYQQNLQNLIPDLLGYLHDNKSVTYHQVVVWLARRRLQSEWIVWSHSRASQLLAQVEQLYLQEVKDLPMGLMVTLNFEAAIHTLNHD